MVGKAPLIACLSLIKTFLISFAWLLDQINLFIYASTPFSSAPQSAKFSI
jgi:uncharacterized protein YbgA (DUF1722 family)